MLTGSPEGQPNTSSCQNDEEMITFCCLGYFPTLPQKTVLQSDSLFSCSSLETRSLLCLAGASNQLLCKTRKCVSADILSIQPEPCVIHQQSSLVRLPRKRKNTKFSRLRKRQPLRDQPHQLLLQTFSHGK